MLKAGDRDAGLHDRDRRSFKIQKTPRRIGAGYPDMGQTNYVHHLSETTCLIIDRIVDLHRRGRE
jgi:hypothetical protein